ncbi:hypothetical protein JMG10_03395 [Nostoc ellipsosporum NOK]|nr:hypothetical protein [Nostoc ellipsosporum NOK]
MNKKIFRLLVVVLSITAAMSAIIMSCRKLDYSHTRAAVPTDFFNIRGIVKPEVLRVIENLKQQNAKTGFIGDFVKKYGSAVWHKAFVSSAGSSSAARGLGGKSDTAYVLIPIAFENTPQVHAAMACTVLNDSVLAIRLLDGRDYPSYASRTTPGVTAYELSLTLMQLDKEVFGHDFFMFTDSLAAKGKGKGIGTVKLSETDTTYFRMIQATYTTCVIINVPLNNGQVVGCPGGTPNCPQYNYGLECTTYTVWFDDGTGNGGTSGGGSEGGGENNGGGSGGGAGPKPCRPAGGRLIVDGRVAPLCEDEVPVNPPTGPGWAPLTDHEAQLGYHHFDDWEVSAEDLQAIRYWKNRNIDTTGLDSCLRIVVQKLLNSAGNINSPLGQMLVKMNRSVFEKANLTKFKIKIESQILDTNVLGRSQQHNFDSVTKVFSATIVLNKRYLNSATELRWLTTITHEFVHTYLSAMHYRYFSSLSPATIQNMDVNNLFTSYIDSLLVRNTREEIYNFNLGDPEMDHNFMADYLINAFAKTLELVEGGNIQNKRYYWFMAWSGLYGTKTWKQHWSNYPSWPPANPAPSEDSTRGLRYALTEERLDSIITANSHESTGNPNALGKPKITGGCY